MSRFIKLKSFLISITLVLTVGNLPTIAYGQTQNDPMYFVVSGGLAFADVSETANTNGQALANALGQTVTVEYDRASWIGRLAGGYEIADSLSLEVGYIMTGDIDIEYSIPGAKVTESYNGNGLDFALKLDFEDSGAFLKAGIHNSDLNAKATVTLSGSTVASAAATASGTGTLIGGGFEQQAPNGEITYWGYDLYMNIGDVDDANFGMLYYGWRF